MYTNEAIKKLEEVKSKLSAYKFGSRYKVVERLFNPYAEEYKLGGGIGEEIFFKVLLMSIVFPPAIIEEALTQYLKNEPKELIIKVDEFFNSKTWEVLSEYPL